MNEFNTSLNYSAESPILFLSEKSIRHALEKLNSTRQVHLHLANSIDSTNRYLRELASSPAIEVCIAETQTAGRGRFGRDWHSPFGENIYFSGRYCLDCRLSDLSGLSLVVSLAMIDILKRLIPKNNIQVKWPNDLIWSNRKLAGCLIELITEPGWGTEVIIGIGLNVNSDTEKFNLNGKPCCSLYSITGNYFDRNTLIAQMIVALNSYLEEFIEDGFQAFAKRWQQVDYLYQQKIRVSQAKGIIQGVAMGVDKKGQLLLSDGKELHCLSSGDTSLSL